MSCSSERRIIFYGDSRTCAILENVIGRTGILDWIAGATSDALKCRTRECATATYGPPYVVPHVGLRYVPGMKLEEATSLPSRQASILRSHTPDAASSDRRASYPPILSPMCHSPLHPFLAAVPKCEHHMHLEGSLSPSLLFRLAVQNSIALPSPAVDASFSSPESLLDRYTRFTSLDDFLHYYFIGMSVLLRADDFEALAWEYFLRAKADGVLHAEVFFDAQAHTGRGIAYKTVLEGFRAACRRAERELGLSTLLILCFLRHLPVTSAGETFETAREDLKKGVLAGIGLDSSETDFPPDLFRTVYASAKEASFKRTAHAGEEGPASYVRDAISLLDIQRIDHGFRLAEDEALMADVARKQMLVTLCPLSNVRLRCVKNVEQLPIRTFLDAGVSFSINSDDPGYFGGYILDNYCVVQEAFGLTVEEWVRIALAGIDGSWCGEKRKAELVEGLERVVKQYTIK